MHIAPVVHVPHSRGPEAWVEAVEEIGVVLESRPDLVVTVRMAGIALDHVRQTDAWQRLPRERVRWLAGGMSDPVLPLLPPRARQTQLNREASVMESAGLVPAGLWLGDAWEPSLVELARESGHSRVYLDGSLFEGTPSRPGAIEWAGQVVIGVALAEDAPETEDEDGLAVIRVDSSALAELVASPGGRLLDVDAYLEDHLPGDRLEPRVSTPRLAPGREVFYRRLLLLTADQPQRRSGGDDVLLLQSREHLLDHAPDSLERLLAVRTTLDTARRGDTWVDIQDVDWDADGVAEIHVETATTSLMLDPAETALGFWDHKPNGWAIVEVPGSRAAHLLRCLDDSDRETASGPLRAAGRTEGRGFAELRMEGRDGTACRIELRQSALTIELTLPGAEPMRVGPELPVNLAGAQVRADGGAWVDADEPVALAGHRFRISDGQRSLVLATPRPAELFVTPAPDGGYILWPHWVTADGGTYRISLIPS